MKYLNVDDVKIEYEVRGDGEPVLLIPPSVTADGLAVPLFGEPELASRYRLIQYHRRGTMGSTRGAEPMTFPRQARDAAALLRHLGVKNAHIAGHSFGGTIALQLAVDAPELVHSLALLEAVVPFPGGTAILQERMRPMVDAYRSGNKREAVQLFGDVVFGPDWQASVEQAVPGGLEQSDKDVDALFQELPGMQSWQFGPREVAAIRQPVLSVLGARSGPFMTEGRALLHSWFPQTEDVDLPTTHLLQMADPKGVAHGLAGFFGRHPIK